MPFPVSMTQVHVTGSMDQFPSGASPAEASITYECPYWLIGPTDGSIVPPFDVVATPDSEGVFTSLLPTGDDPDWNAVGVAGDWPYVVTLRADGKRLKATAIVPGGGGDVQLSDILDFDGVLTPGETYLPRSLRGAPGGVASLDLSGRLPANQLPAGMDPVNLLLMDEDIIPRFFVAADYPLQSGRLFLTDFIGRKTVHRTVFSTTLGGTPGVGGTHCWVMIYELVAGSYVRRAISVDDPTRWAGSPYAEYNTPMAWDEVEGAHYAAGFLWVGSGQPPTLPAHRVFFVHATKTPRMNAYLDGLTGATSTVDIPNPLNPAFTGNNDTRFQAFLA
jgi:hypothetical protein